MSKELKYVKLYAQYMFEAKKYDRAIPHLKILGEEHKDVESLIMLGTIYESMKDFEQANKYYLEAILLGSVECLYNLGLMQVKNNMRDLGKRYLDEGSKKGLVNATLLAGDVYAEENKVREALKYYTTALRQEIPDDLIVPTKLKIGIIYQATGEISKAISVFNELKEYNTTAKFNLANIYTDQKKYEMAKTLYLQLDPTKLDDPQHIYLINYAKILIIQRFYAKAEEIITPLVQQQVAAAYVLAAELFANKEDLVKANQFLSLAIGATKGKKLGEVY
jgi:predicted negative regulator of RcsB-dependent stress response